MPTGDSCVGANTYITFAISDLNTARLLQFGLSPSDHLNTVRRSCSAVVEFLPPALYRKTARELEDVHVLFLVIFIF